MCVYVCMKERGREVEEEGDGRERDTERERRAGSLLHLESLRGESYPYLVQLLRLLSLLFFLTSGSAAWHLALVLAFPSTSVVCVPLSFPRRTLVTISLGPPG